MHKGLFASLMLVLSLSTVVSALVVQDQVLGLGAANSVLIGGAGFDSATSTNLIQGSALQQTSSANGRVQVFQYEDGTLYQTAYAAGVGGVFGVQQVGNALGVQTQEQGGGSGPANQNQFLGAALSQGLIAQGGEGIVGATDGFVGHQVQVTVSRTGLQLNISKLDVRETGLIRVGP